MAASLNGNESTATATATASSQPPFLRDPTFAAAEKDAPLMEKNEGFCEAEGEGVFEKTQNWPQLLGLDIHAATNEGIQGSDGAAVLLLPPLDEAEVGRIIEKDVERTFLCAPHRAVLLPVLRTLAREFRSYAQAMAHVCAFLMLFYDKETSMAMMRVINSQAKYIPGYWTTEAVAFATDAYVFLPMLQKLEPQVASALQAKCILPETYLQKWWVVLCIQSLPFHIGVEFMRHFLRDGYVWLFQFALIVHRHFRSELAAAKDHATTYKILRLEKSVLAANPITTQTLQEACQLTVEFLVPSQRDPAVVEAVDIAAARQYAYDTYLKARLERARALQKEQEEEEDDELDDEDDEDDK